MKKPTGKELYSFNACAAYGLVCLLKEGKITYQELEALKRIHIYIESLCTKELKMKKQTKHQKIIALYKEGMKPKDIAAKLKIKTQTVYAAKHLENKKTEKAKDDICNGGIMRVINPRVNRYTTNLRNASDEILKMIKQDCVVVSEPGKKTLLQKIKRFLFGA